MAPHAERQEQRAGQCGTEDGAADADQDRQQHHQGDRQEVVRDLRAHGAGGQMKASHPTDDRNLSATRSPAVSNTTCRHVPRMRQRWQRRA
jgi:hypothetical protein